VFDPVQALMLVFQLQAFSEAREKKRAPMNIIGFLKKYKFRFIF